MIIHLSTPRGCGAETVAIHAHQGGFLHVHLERGAVEQKCHQGTHERFVAGKQNGALVFARTNLFPCVVRRCIGNQGLGLDHLALVAERLGRHIGGLHGAAKGAREDLLRSDAGSGGALQNAAQFLAAFRGERAVGIGLPGTGVFGDAVAQQVNLHQGLAFFTAARFRHGLLRQRAGAQARQSQARNVPLQRTEDLGNGLSGIDHGEPVGLHHGIQGLDEAGLVAHEALVHVGAEAQVHAAFPVIEGAASQNHARHQLFHFGAQVEDGVGHQGEARHLLDPRAVLAAGDGARHDGKDVAVDEDHETGAQGGDDLVLQAVGEIGGVEQGHGDGAEGVAFLGHLDALAGERRAGHAGVEHGVAFLFEPLAEQHDLGAAAHGVGALDDDQLALQLGRIDTGERLAIELEGRWFAHGTPLRRAGAGCRSSGCRPAC